MKIRLLFFIAIAMVSCLKDENPLENSIVLEGQVFIGDTITTEIGQGVVIMPGAEIDFGPDGIIIANGSIYVRGSKTKPIKLTGSQERISHRIIQVKWDAKEFIVEHSIVDNGMITSVANWNYLSEVEFINSKKLNWSDAVARFWSGNVLIENCVTKGNNRGEGFLFHDINKPIVRNCHFDKTPDAVEFINCFDGTITNNIFRDMSDDAIDQNSCHGTEISNNEFYNVGDRALELGSENFGSSHALNVRNNLFVNCSVAINLKESSDALVENATFYDNNIAMEIITHQDSSRISSALLSRCVFSENDMQLKFDSRSVLQVESCLSDVEQLIGENNKLAEIEFFDPQKDDFAIRSLDFPQGLDALTIGYQR